MYTLQCESSVQTTCLKYTETFNLKSINCRVDKSIKLGRMPLKHKKNITANPLKMAQKLVVFEALFFILKNTIWSS